MTVAAMSQARVRASRRRDSCRSPRERRCCVTLRSPILFPTLLALSTGTAISADAQPAPEPPRNLRLVHAFDFDERRLGNLEDVPKYWERLRPDGFPHYARGVFDDHVGRAAQPSFHLESQGRNVAFEYAGPDTPIGAATDFRIEGYIRPDNLEHARACLTAHFVDRYGQALPETLVRSRCVAGGTTPGSDEWIKVNLELTAAPPGSARIAVGAWVLQQDTWRTEVPTRWHIPWRDIDGGAWFDDIRIYALPHIALTTTAPGNVLAPDAISSSGPRTENDDAILVRLADIQDPSLRGRLTIRAADGTRVHEETLGVEADTNAPPHRIPAARFGPGLYRAALEVFAQDERITARQLTFAVRPPHQPGKERGRLGARAFGIVLDPQHRLDVAQETALLRTQLVRSAQIPVWAGPGGDVTVPRFRERMDRTVQELVEQGFSLTGVFAAVPAAMNTATGPTRSLTELLAGDPAGWREYVATVVAPYGSAFRWWQMGASRPADIPTTNEGSSPNPGATAPLQRDRRPDLTALAQLREAIERYLTSPRIAVPQASINDIDPGPFRAGGAERVTVALHESIPHDRIADVLDAYRRIGPDQPNAVAAYIEPLPTDRYDRLHRLTDWAKRVLLARTAGAVPVFVPQTWSIRSRRTGAQSVEAPIVEPDETFLALRTIADVVGDAAAGPRLRLTEGVTCLSFLRGDEAILALWDDAAPPPGRTHAIQLGRAHRVTDLWGRETTLERTPDGRHQLRLDASPVFVEGIERWLIEFRAGVDWQPSRVRSGSDIVQHRFIVFNTTDRPISGEITLDTPASWDITPRRFAFSLMPQRRDRETISVRYPHSEPAGERAILARIRLGGSGYNLLVPLPVEIETPELNVRGLAVMEGDRLVLRQTVTNRSTDTLSLRASASVPGRARQYRPISALEPGETQIVEYQFADATGLIGRTARLMLREVAGQRRVHNLELPIP